MRTQAKRALLSALSVVLLPVIVVGSQPEPAGAATAPSSVSTTFSFTGDEQTFVVPDRVFQVQVTAIGGRGASTILPGGNGASVTGEVGVEPGTMLSVIVGGNADGPDGGFNGGAAGGVGPFLGIIGAGGGGASEVRDRPTGDPGAGDALVVAGGGGGAGGATQHHDHSFRAPVATPVSAAEMDQTPTPAIPAAAVAQDPSSAVAPGAARASPCSPGTGQTEREARAAPEATRTGIR